MRSRGKQILFGIIIISVSLRIIAAFFLGDKVIDLPGTFDQISYHKLALRVLGGFGFTFGEQWWPLTAASAPTAHWSYLYTLYLTAVYALFGPHPLAARLIQALIVGSLQIILVYLIGRRLFDEIVGLISAGLTAVYAYFIYYAATLMTEPFYITSILASLYLAILIVDRAKKTSKSAKEIVLLGFFLGVTLGITVLLRQLFLLVVPLYIVWVWWASRKSAPKKVLTSLTLSGLVILLMILPFTIFNYVRFNRFVLLNTNAGFAFFWGNHPIYGTHFIPILPPEMGTYQDLIPEELRNLDEAALDQALLKRGLNFIFDDPVRYIELSISRIPIYFMFWSSDNSGTISNVARIISFGVLWPFMLYGLLLTIFSRKYDFSIDSPIFLLAIYAVLYSIIHLLTWALIRYRLPVDAVMLLFAGVAFYDLYQRAQILLHKTRTRTEIIGHSGPPINS